MFGILATEKSSRWLLGKSIKFAVKLIYFFEYYQIFLRKFFIILSLWLVKYGFSAKERKQNVNYYRVL